MLEKEIITIRDVIVNTIPLERLYLFGSYADGTFSSESDYDFYAIIPDDSMRPLDAMYEVGMALWGVKSRSMDFIAGTREMFERRSGQLATLEREIASKGVLLYESGE